MACSGKAPSNGPADPNRLVAKVRRPDSANVSFALPATAQRCPELPGTILLEAASEQGYGLVALLKGADSLMPVLAHDDSLAPRGARVATRYMIRDMAHAFAADSGSVKVTRGRGDSISAALYGSGLDGGVRAVIDARFTGLPVTSDTATCKRPS